MKKEFNEWIKTFRDSITGWDYYTNFDKVYINVDKIRVELSLLNSLVGSKNIEKDFINLFKRYPEILKAIPILIAKREDKLTITGTGFSIDYDFFRGSNTVEQYVFLMHKTGLFDLISNRIFSNLIDYVQGVEVGLDSNARKNRIGTTMENIVEGYILELIEQNNEIQYFKDINTNEIEKIFNVTLNKEENEFPKELDFLIKTKDFFYIIETKFYSGSGSKLNEVARRYKLKNEQIISNPFFKFVWIIDGIGWHFAKKSLQETYESVEHIINLKDLETGILEKIIK